MSRLWKHQNYAHSDTPKKNGKKYQLNFPNLADINGELLHCSA